MATKKTKGAAGKSAASSPEKSKVLTPESKGPAAAAGTENIEGAAEAAGQAVSDFAGAIKKLKPAASKANKNADDDSNEVIKKLRADNAALAKQNAELTKEVKGNSLPSFEVDDDEENDIEGGEYDFTCPTFTHDDGSVIDVRELMVGFNSKDRKVAEKAQAIVANLVKIKSGIVQRKES